MKNQKMPPIRDGITGKPRPPVANPGYYPGYSTLSQEAHWDQATRKTVEKRMSAPSALKFFTEHQGEVLRAVLAIVMPQSDRDAEHQIPLIESIDERLAARRFNGYIYEGTVEDDESHLMGISALQAMAKLAYEKEFLDLSFQEQESLLISIKDGRPGPAWKHGSRLPPEHYWANLMQDSVSAYYAHPFAWDEIGFGGPAYPRGYMRLTGGLPDPWETDENRHQWMAPEGTRSDEYELNTKMFSESGDKRDN